VTDPPLLLIRHAKAGSRDRWEGDDRDRPLTEVGREQARLLGPLLEGVPIARILSSPFARCVETVRPLARERGLPIEETDELVEGAPLPAALELIERLSTEAAALCGHGDLIPELVTHFGENGVRIDGDEAWKKGSVWILERADGAFASARYLPPPA
jgi:8-oxo-dGTP diphosphatase